MKAVIVSLLIFILISTIAVSYQLYLTKLAEDIKYYSDSILKCAPYGDKSSIEENINKLNILWNKNKNLLMIFHDHSSINTAAAFLELANNALINRDYNRVSAEIIQFSAIITELSSENIPSLENIL